MSGRTQSVTSDEWIEGAGTVLCLSCGLAVAYNVRATDLSPWARIRPHRTDGTPTR